MLSKNRTTTRVLELETKWSFLNSSILSSGKDWGVEMFTG